MRQLAALLLLMHLAACSQAAPGEQSALATAQILRTPEIAVRAVVPSTLTPSVVPTAAPVAPSATSTPAPVSPSPQVMTLDESGTREVRLIELVNELRAGNGLAAYTAEPALGAVARAHSCDLAAHSQISHSSSDGRDLQARLGSEVGRWAWPSESIAAGTDDPAQVIALWLDEPPDGWHRRNLLDPEQQVIGVGYCAAPDDPTGNRHYWTMIVARRAA